MTTKALHPSLPSKPTFLSTEDSSPLYEYAHNAEQPEASSSTPPKPLCAMCMHVYAKYTCPGCSMRTCSAACSSSHKSRMSCTGERNKVAYVPMNNYTWGKMMDDYVFLEDMGRKVGDWGTEVVRGGYIAGNANARGRGDSRRTRGRGRGGGGASGQPKTKRDILKMQLEARDIEMDLLPVGMEKRKLNQSTWDFKHQKAMLTIEFKIYKPKDPLAPSSQPVPSPLRLLTHRNDMNTSLIYLLRSHIPHGGKSKKVTGHPEWVKQLVHPDPDDPDSFVNPQCVMVAPLDPTSSSGQEIKKAHYSFDASKPLVDLLVNTHFVEFPDIEVWSEFSGIVIDAQGVMQLQETKSSKRRKLNPKAGKQAIVDLLGGYGSESEDEGPRNVLEALGDYAGSDEEDEANHARDADNISVVGFSDDECDMEVDPAALVELMRSVRGEGPWTADVGEEVVDWGDDDTE